MRQLIGPAALGSLAMRSLRSCTFSLEAILPVSLIKELERIGFPAQGIDGIHLITPNSRRRHTHCLGCDRARCDHHRRFPPRAA